MSRFRVKYIVLVASLLLISQFVSGWGETPRSISLPSLSEGEALQDTTKSDSRSERRRRRQEQKEQRVPEIEPLSQAEMMIDTIIEVDSLIEKFATVQRMEADTATNKKTPLEAPIKGKAVDSLYYDLTQKKVYLYNQGDVAYGDFNLKADYMDIDLNTNNIYAYGSSDTIDGELQVKRPEFIQGSSTLNMDTITYNIESQRAKIKGIATQQGDGWLIGHSVKKMEDNNINISDGMYTTCDHTDHPHFYYRARKIKVIPGKKAILGPGCLTIEDVEIPFLGLPEAFFPLSSGPKSGILMPTYGEEANRGFFIRGLGYYFRISDHIDLTLTGGYYTLGSWEVSAISRYVKRYKFSGNMNFNYSSVRTGTKGDLDYMEANTFQFQWTHQQDPKANPGSTFSASVNLTSSGYSKYSATNLNDMLATQTNSSISC